MQEGNCAVWNYRCQTNATVSDCSVGCKRMAGCMMSSGRLSAGCAPDLAQCVCSAAMTPLVETMYWSCDGDHWEVKKMDWKNVVEALGCSSASLLYTDSLLLAAFFALHTLHALLNS